MIVVYTQTAVREKVGDGWRALFFKKVRNTIMIETLWDNIDPEKTFEQNCNRATEISKGHERIKKTATVSRINESILDICVANNTMPSIVIEKY